MPAQDMDVAKVQLDRIRQQLAGLSATQRMLVGTLVAVMVLTMMYWGKYAGSPEMVPVLDQVLNDDEIGRIDMMLVARGVPHTVVGGRIHVPAERKMEIVADLMYQQMLPRDSRSAFDEMIKKSNPFGSHKDSDVNYNLALQTALAQVMRRFPGVADAQVIINAKSERRVENSIVPTATVFISMRDPSSAPTKQLITAAADGVAGTVSGLTRGHVSVIVNGRSNRVPDADANVFGSGDDLMDVKVRTEQRLEQKIRDQFAYIPGMTATVTVDVDNRTRSEQSMTYDPDRVIVKPTEINSTNQETTNSSAAAADPGVGANTGVPILAGGLSGGGGSQNSTTSEEKIKNQILASSTQSTTQTPAGKDTVQSATVRVPRSYFVGVYKQRSASAKEPDEAALMPLVSAELASIRDGVKKCIGLKSDGDLSVDTYADAIAGSALVMATTSSPASPALGSVTAYGKEIAIGVLAVVSLFLMSSMVRKSTPAPLVAMPILNEPPQILTAGEGLAGEASTTDATLAGMELDEDAVHTQQMLEQVSTMVKENPDGAAALVKRWLNRT